MDLTIPSGLGDADLFSHAWYFFEFPASALLIIDGIPLLFQGYSNARSFQSQNKMPD
jgi:hypothetical protein